MLMLTRAVLGLCAFLAGWFLSYWLYFSGFELDGRPFLGRGVPFLIGLAAALVILVATHQMRHGFLSAIVLGAVALGSLGFVAEQFGPAVLAPDVGPGPLLGLLLTAPGGVLIGAPLGAFGWWAWRRREPA